MKSKKDLKIVFFGTPEFAVASLDVLVKEGYNVAAVVTMPDKIGGRGHKVIESDVKKYAVANNLPLLQPEKLKGEDFVEALRAIKADLFIVIAFRMLPEIVWTMPPLGTFNLHASLLPRYRGAAPINRALMNGETRTGVTTFFLKHEIDTGDIIQQKSVEIGPDENVGSLYERLMHIGAELTLDTVAHILNGDLKPMPQELLLGGTEPVPAPKIFKEDCRIDWNCTAAAVHNLVRGLSPYPGAWCEIKTGKELSTLKIFATVRTGKSVHNKPGTIIADGRHVYAAAGDELIELITVQPSGKKSMAAADWWRGMHFDSNSPELV